MKCRIKCKVTDVPGFCNVVNSAKAQFIPLDAKGGLSLIIWKKDVAMKTN